MLNKTNLFIFILCSTLLLSPTTHANTPLTKALASLANTIITIKEKNKLPPNTTYVEITQSEIDNVLRNMSPLYTDIRAVPYFKNGVAKGFKILSVKKGSIFDKIGIIRGDVLEKINDHTPDIQTGFQIFTKLAKQTTPDSIYTLTITRNKKTHYIQIKFTELQALQKTNKSNQIKTLKKNTPPELKENNIINYKKEELENLSKLLTDIRAIPYYTNGINEGLKLLSVRRGSFWNRIGLKRRDLLLSINDNKVTLQNNQFDMIGKTPQTKFTIKRNNKLITINVVFE